MIVLLLSASFGFQSCNNGKTYAELKEDEENAIQRFIAEKDIKVISEDEFLKDTVTSVEDNEFVYLEKNGVYMQILERGEGEVLGDGRYDISTKFVEMFIDNREISGTQFNSGDTLATNIYSPLTECLLLTVSGNSFQGQFTSNDKTSYIMPQYYSSQAVPSGWLIPFSYLKMKRYISAQPSEKWVRVKLIVPHSEGTSTAMQSVYPCYYEITYFLH